MNEHNSDIFWRKLQASSTSLLRELDKIDSRRLSGFIRCAWHILEPGRKFVHNWHIDAMSDHLEAVTAGQITRLLINVPPGGMKSLETNVFWPAWEWGPMGLPSMRYIHASYAKTLTVRDNRKSRILITHPWYQERWGHQFAIVGDQNEKIKFENDKSGWKLATSVRGVGTGERGDRFGIDDPHNVLEGESEAVRNETLEWLNEVVPTRLNDQERSAIVVIMQRVHRQDVSGEILEKELGYTHLMLPMEFEPERRCYTVVKPTFRQEKKVRGRYLSEKQQWFIEGKPIPKDILDQFGSKIARLPVQEVYNQDPRTQEGELLWPAKMTARSVARDKKALGAYATAGQFQQRPSSREGNLFKRHWFDGKIIDVCPELIAFVRHWDLAATKKKTAARTAGVGMGLTPDGRFIVVDCQADQLEDFEVKKLIKSTAQTDYLRFGGLMEISLPQDPGQAGKVQKRDMLRLLAAYDVHISPESGDKEDRARPFASQAEGGNVYIVNGSWVPDYIDELCDFPASKFKDRVDASSGAYGRLLLKMPEDDVVFEPPIMIDLNNGETAYG